MAAAALCRRSPSLLGRRHLLIRLLSTETQIQAPPTPTTPADLSRLKASIRDSATKPDALAGLFLSGLPHPAFLADRPLFALSVRRLANAGRRDLVASILSSSLTALPSPHPSEASFSASSPSTPLPACPTTPSPPSNSSSPPPNARSPLSSPPTTTTASTTASWWPSTPSPLSWASSRGSSPTTSCSSLSLPEGALLPPARCSMKCRKKLASSGHRLVQRDPQGLPQRRRRCCLRPTA
ncbi:unnamed protein product [Urochloa humidicola]